MVPAGTAAGKASWYQHALLAEPVAPSSEEERVKTLSDAECEDYRETTSCSWTEMWACPGKPRGSLGFVRSLPRFAGVACCCGAAADARRAARAAERDALVAGSQSLFAPYLLDGVASLCEAVPSGDPR